VDGDGSIEPSPFLVDRTGKQCYIKLLKNL
jgi:hypothetical protein